MRFIWALIWSFALVHMMSYVIGSMTGGTYDFNQASIFSVVLAVLVLAIAYRDSKRASRTTLKKSPDFIRTLFYFTRTTNSLFSTSTTT